jgi:serine/threonine/tyrosine-interacting protein
MEPNLKDIIDHELTIYTDKKPSLDLIIDNLFLGNYPAALDKDLLKSLKVTHILVAGKDLESLYKDDFSYKIIPLYDSPNTNIGKYFEESNNFINSGLEEGVVYVHCGHGVSRSASLVIAYVMFKNQIPFSEAYALVRSKRACIKPNTGFEKYLRDYSYQLVKKF